jgi:2-succinyl-5-enolpyruvyl-6-hydroxy-3-cyclohexene-1-carboxylate synthase
VAHYDALLRSEPWAQAHRPDLVLRVGDLPTSKPLRQWLHALPDAVQIAFDPESAWQDPAGYVSMTVGADPRATLTTVGERLPPRRDRAWLDGWLAADAAAGKVIGAMLDPRVLSEPLVATELGRRLPPNATLVVASSMPVRDVETFFPVRNDAPRVLANRGANGIDGTVSTAFGAAAAAPHGPAVLLVGDVALAHDIGGLLAATRAKLKLTIVLVDNDGGGIFAFLPVSGEGADYVEHVVTPHGLDPARIAELYGCGHERAEGLEGFRTALDRALQADRTTIVSVRTDRDENLALHRRLWEAVARSVREGT